MDQGMLSGVRVLDFTWVLAGPYATRLLADFGAEVIKIQSKKTAKGAESNLTGYFNTWNRNKRSITLDMSFPEAKPIVLKLVSMGDIVIENFSPRVMSNWGLNYDRLKEVNPDLIMVSLSGMGQTGPWRNFLALGPTIHALSGITYLTSFAKDSPVGLGYAYADIIAGLYAAFAVLAALEYRDRTGQGEYIDLSEYEAMLTCLGPTLLDAFLNHREILPQGNRSDSTPAAPYGCYPCLGEDRWCVLAVFNGSEWEALGKALGNPAWMKEERFSTYSRRKEHQVELNEHLRQWACQRTAEEVVELLQEAGVTAGLVQNAEDLAKDPHLAARKFFVNLEHPVLGKTLSDSSPIKFSENLEGNWKAAPLLGEDNQYVFKELLSLKESEFSAYVQKGIIG
ncbi:MAG: CoA transferase [Deltaproteobacteria bacterium]|nr:CoA transferase [Deltaproteobacteria bacterium]